MEEKINKVNTLIDESSNIPEKIKAIVKAICKGYIRESNGKIPIEAIVNVCNTTFQEIDENDKYFSGEKRIFARTSTNYDDECNVIHKVSYLNHSNYIKLITILTHELGHVITEYKPCEITKQGIYPLVKRTTTIYLDCFYKDNELRTKNKFYGFCMSDGFLESICTKIFASSKFREELLKSGYDLKDYIYKDERLFSSRVYDEYKACFELFDYIMDGKLFDFSCKSFINNAELIKNIEENRLITIFEILDQSNDALWSIKKYEGKESDEFFTQSLDNYVQKKETSLLLASACLTFFGKKEDDKKYKKLYNIYSSTLEKQKQLPLPLEYIKREK